MSEANVQVVKKLLAAFRARDVDASLPNADPDIELRAALVGGPEGEVYRGVEGAQRFWEAIDAVWERFDIEPSEFRDLGDRVLVLGTVTARGRSSGVDFHTEAAWLADLRDGRVHRWQSFAPHADGLAAADES